MRMHGGSPTSGGRRCLAAVASPCGRGRTAPQPAMTDEPGALSDRGPRSARVSLTMIVKDEEKNLPHCLDSVRGIFDEIVVVDTGSTDRTRSSAREFGARVFEFPWIDDFAAARNASLAHATGDYAFWLDADDVIDPSRRETLRCCSTA